MSLVVSGYPGTVGAHEFARMTAFFALHGVSNDLVVTPVGGQDRTVRVSYSRSWAPGLYTEMTEPMDVGPLPPNPSGNPRRDRIILRHDWSANDGEGETTLTFKQGTPSSNPSLPPVVTNEGALYEQHLAAVTVGPGQGQLSAGDISMTGLARSSPMVMLEDDSAVPLFRLRATVLNSGTGLLRYSDGSGYNPLRLRLQDLYRYIYARTGAGTTGNLGSGNAGFLTTDSSIVAGPVGGSFAGGTGSVSTQFRLPVAGLWRIECSTRIIRTNANQTGDLILQFRGDMTGSSPGSGNVVSSSRTSISGSGSFTDVSLSRVRNLASGTLRGFTVANNTSHQIQRDAMAFSLEYLGPNS